MSLCGSSIVLRSPDLDFSLQQMPYAFENPANAYCNEDDKLARCDRELLVASVERKKALTITVKLTGMKAPMPVHNLKQAAQSGRPHFQFDPPKRFMYPMSLADLKERSKKMAEHGWNFDAKKLSSANPNQGPYSAHELTKEEYDWLSGLKLEQVLDEKRARQAAVYQGKQSLTWETNDVDTADCELFNDKSLDEELNAFYGPTGKVCSKIDDIPIDCEGNVDDNAAMSTPRVSLPAEDFSQFGGCSDFRFHMNSVMSFADSGISVGDHFSADITKMSTAGIDNGNLFPHEVGQLSPPDFTMEDFIVTEPSNAPSAIPTFSVQEASEADRDFFRNLYRNNIGVREQFLDAPYDLEGWATEVVHYCDDNSTQNQYVGNPYDPERSFTQDANLPDSEKTQYPFASPDQFLDGISPAHNTVVQLGITNNISAGPVNFDISAQFNASDMLNLSLAGPKQDAACHPDSSVAAGNQLLTDVQADAGPTVGVSALASTRPFSAESESSSDIIASSSPSRVTPYLPRGSKMLSSSRRTNLLPESDSSDSEREDGDKSVKALPASTPSNMTYPGTCTVDCSIQDCSAADFDEITSMHLNLRQHNLPTPPVVPSTPTNKGHTCVRNIIRATPENSTPINEKVIAQMHAYHAMTTPIAAGPTTPTTPLTPSFSTSDPYTAYSFTASPTPNGPCITTVLHGQTFTTPKKRTPEEEAVIKVKRARARKIAAAKEAAARNAVAKEAAARNAVAKEAAKQNGTNDQPPKKRARRSKPKAT